MIINRFNYEIYLVDYLDGKLNALQVDELLLFLDQNPDIKEEFEGMEDAVLIAETTIFPNKSSLKKKSFQKDGIDDKFHYLCIAATEGLLSKEEKNTFEKSLQGNPAKQKAYGDFQKAKILPETSIVYTNKSHLKRTSIVPIRYSYLRLSINAAATITLLLGIYTIGRVIIKEAPIKNATITAETIGTSSQKQSTTEIKQPLAIFETHITKEVEHKTSPSSNVAQIIQEKLPPIDREEYIPNPIRRKKLLQLDNQIDPQFEMLAHAINKLYPVKQIDVEPLLAQRNKSGIFETIQYGLKSFGKLIGRDIKLDANKDEKGNIETISFESKLIAFSTQVKND